MTREHRTADVFAATVPETVNPDDDEQLTKLLQYLNAAAQAYVYRQWDGSAEKPLAITGMVSEWTITDKPEDIEKFQPAHDCVACRAGNDQTLTYLRNNPGRWVAMANLNYTEVWAK